VKILLLTNRVPYPLRDGGALAMDAMIRGYHALGWEVQVLAMNTSRHQVSADLSAKRYPQISAFRTVDVDNEVSKAGVLKNLFFSKEPEHAQRFRSRDFATALKSCLQRFLPDVVQLESPFLASYLPLIRQSPNALVVYRMHNVEGQIWSRLSAETPGLKGRYLSILAKRITRYETELWRKADLLLPITNDDAVAVRDAGIQTPVQLAPYGVDRLSAATGLPCGAWKAYHIGAMDWLPNAAGVRWFLDEVWPKAHEWSPKLQFHFAGRNMPVEFKSALPEGAFCEGEVPDAEAFISDKHILVVPIRSGGGIRIKILEAMAAGKLVISTGIGMQGIDAENGIHFRLADGVQDFAHTLAWAAAHPEKAAVIAEFGQRLVREQYHAPAIMERVTTAIRGLMADR
jgi:glycosyltransferase involved in cell wall biosynthesis